MKNFSTQFFSFMNVEFWREMKIKFSVQKYDEQSLQNFKKHSSTLNGFHFCIFLSDDLKAYFIQMFLRCKIQSKIKNFVIMYKIIIRESIGFDFCNYMNIRKLNNILDYYWKLLFYPQYDYTNTNTNTTHHIEMFVETENHALSLVSRWPFMSNKFSNVFYKKILKQLFCIFFYKEYCNRNQDHIIIFIRVNYFQWGHTSR